ncbi:MAG: cytochrome P450 [Proteobacteria bacterium]|nr:cytochrome P450 [Pseudomonadota bacterium]
MEITDGFELVDHATYGREGPPHALWARLRAESPVHPCRPQGYEPFWAITRHADVSDISKRPDDFLNAPGIVLMNEHQQKLRASGDGVAAMRTIIEMDPPEHRSYRKVASPWFSPRAVGRVDEEVQTSAREIVNQLAGSTGEGECDFATDVATAHPLRILSAILGLPREAEPKILRLTNELFAAEDPDLQRAGEDRQKAAKELGLEMFQLFSEIIEDRRANPQDDLATVLANGKIDGQPMGPMETVGYYLITFTAGHDTTKNALAGGMHALLQHPDELAKLKRNPELVKPAIEEIVRWTAPVNYMKRTAACEAEIRGQRIQKGDNLVLFYASANRDEEVFEDPFSFRVDRKPNPHLGFGIGEHFCLGANLARKSQIALWQELAPRLEALEPAGDPEYISSSFVVGLKKLPIRYRITPAR